jgi:hypothetical protein
MGNMDKAVPFWNINTTNWRNIIKVVRSMFEKYDILCCHLDVVREPSNPHDPESDASGSLSSWQAHPSR